MFVFNLDRQFSGKNLNIYLHHGSSSLILNLINTNFAIFISKISQQDSNTVTIECIKGNTYEWASKKENILE